MNDEFAQNAMRPVASPVADPENDWRREKQLPKKTAADVLGFVPSNRHERRKAAKLLRSKS